MGLGKNTVVWLKSLRTALIGGAAGGAMHMLSDASIAAADHPFQIVALLRSMAIGAGALVAGYLMRDPWPRPETTTDTLAVSASPSGTVEMVATHETSIPAKDPAP